MAATAERRGVAVTFSLPQSVLLRRSEGACCGWDGLQLARKECFTQACRAVFPGNGTPEPWVETASSSEIA
ncbi:unnamed protein product [Ectocarpus sp. 12 AP-2014]